MKRGVAPIVVVVVGALAVGGLTFAAHQVERSSERYRLHQRAEEAAAALEAVLPVFQVPLSSALAVTDATGPDEASFRQVVGGFLGAGGAASASLWHTGSATPVPLVNLGPPSQLASLPAAELTRRLDEVPTTTLDIIDLTDRGVRAFGFALASGHADASGARTVAYLEIELADDPTSVPLTNDAFDDLDYAVYVGDRPRAEALISATTDDLPLDDPEQITVPWGTGELLLVFVPKHQLVGGLLVSLPWIIAIGGGVLVVAFAWLARRLTRSSEHATRLAELNEQLFHEQRTVAQTLQRQLLPDALPDDEAEPEQRRA